MDTIPEDRPKRPDWLSFDSHHPRQLLFEGSVISMASEISALLNRHRDACQQREADHAKAVDEMRRDFGQLAKFVFHLEQALTETETTMRKADLAKPYKQLRIIKDQLKECLSRAHTTYRDPLGERYTSELAECLDVDGWRYSDEWQHEVIVETREPIVFYRSNAILPGAVIVGAPDKDQ